MLLLKCTKKLLNEIPGSPDVLDRVDPADVTPLNTWYVNQVWMLRRKVLLFVHEQSLFSFIVFGVPKRKLSHLGTILLENLGPVLLSEGVAPTSVDQLADSLTDFRFARTDSRRTLGCMNDLYRMYSHILDRRDSPESCDLLDIAHGMNRTPQRVLDWGYSVHLFLDRLQEELASAPSSVHRTPFRYRLAQKGDGAWIEGLEEVRWGDGFDQRDISFIRTYTACLNATGEEVTYEDLMGLSGAAFKLHIAQPVWCPSATTLGFDIEAPLAAALRYSIEWHNFHGLRPDADRLKASRRALVTSIDAGRPALYSGEECSITVGYRDRGRGLICRMYAAGEDGYTETEVLPWSFGFVRNDDACLERREALTESLRTAVALARTREMGAHPETGSPYLSGFAAYEAWIDGLNEGFGSSGPDLPTGTLHANAHSYAILWNSRRAASVFLRTASHELGGEAETCLKEASRFYDLAKQRLHDGRDCVSFPWSWTSEQRRAEAVTLDACLRLERRAVEAIEQALEHLG
ncbi:MAG: hypothetical protein QGI83_17640 [Candidatus Latescibacteria bacterium]|jgi:hypothetical protein|nr:hypothetical protein [Candidatus Latescibacterota bacterium]